MRRCAFQQPEDQLRFFADELYRRRIWVNGGDSVGGGGLLALEEDPSCTWPAYPVVIPGRYLHFWWFGSENTAILLV